MLAPNSLTSLCGMLTMMAKSLLTILSPSEDGLSQPRNSTKEQLRYAIVKLISTGTQCALENDALTSRNNDQVSNNHIQ